MKQEIAQPKFFTLDEVVHSGVLFKRKNWGAWVEIRGRKAVYENDENSFCLFSFDDVYANDWIKKEPPRTYAITKQQLAEAWDSEIGLPHSQHRFDNFCKRLGIGDE